MKRASITLTITLSLLGILLSSVFILTMPQIAEAQSSGCIVVGGLSGFIAEGGSRSTGAQQFFTGDNIQIGGVLDNGSAMNIHLVVTGPSGTDVTSANPSFVIPSDGTYTVTITNVSLIDGNISASCSGASGGTGDWPGYTDGRIDPVITEPFAIYCRDSALVIYQIFNGEGVETNRVPLVDIGNMYIGETRSYAQGTQLNRTATDTLNITMTSGFKIISLSDCFSRVGAVLPAPPSPPEVIVPIVCGEWWLVEPFTPNPECPDADGDDIYDTIDQCPEENGYGTLSGCPDLDYDGVLDRDDICPDTPYGFGYVVNAEGCDDRDNDGIYSDTDTCPYDPGSPELQGCPPGTDRDGDGILNFQDWCPVLNTENFRIQYPNIVDINGCPDMDGDSLAHSPRADIPDACAYEWGRPENYGCSDLFDFVNFAGTFQDIIVITEQQCTQHVYSVYGTRVCIEYGPAN